MTTRAPAKKKPAAKRTPAARKPRARRCPCGCGEVHPLQLLPAGARYDQDKADRAVRFFPRHLRHVKGRWAGQPFVLEPWQEWHIVRPLFGTVDKRTGLRWYREGLVGLPRKNGKSEIAAGVALYLLVADGEFGAEVYSLAGAKEQASLVFSTARSMVRADPLLDGICKPYRSVIEVPEANSLYRVLSADADLQHGLNPHGAVIDEYHVHKNAEQYEAMTTGAGAREQPLVLTITTAGAAESGPCWDLYQRALSGTDARLYVWWQSAPDLADSSDPAVWQAANPASWITTEYLGQQYAKLPLAVFERLHLNRWPSKGGSTVWPQGRWEACGAAPDIDPDLPCVVGVDAAPRRDKTAVVLDQRDADGVHHVRCWTWQATEELGYLDFDVVEGFLRDLYRDFNVTRIVVDPYAMIRSMMLLAAEGLPVEDFPQSHARMAPASAGLHQLVVEGKLRHGNDPELTEAQRKATIRETAFGWRLDKRKGAVGAIDALIALAMAARVAEQEYGAGDGPRVLVV
jgi:phage terminase large subunit-like protein